jgi:hypothetical protein
MGNPRSQPRCPSFRFDDYSRELGPKLIEKQPFLLKKKLFLLEETVGNVLYVIDSKQHTGERNTETIPPGG